MTLEFAHGQAAHVQAIFDAFKALLPQLNRRFPDRTIVVRPHPSENHEAWREFARTHANVQVIHEDNAVPWLMACKVLLHNGCTTAVEAAVLGQPAVSYQPVSAHLHDYYLPNAFSHAAFTPDQVFARVDAILANELMLIDERQRRRIFARHLSAIDGPPACDRVMDVLQSQARPARHRAGKSAQAWALANARTALKLAAMLRPGHRSSLRYHRQRFPAISAPQIQQRIARLAELLGRFSGIEVEAIAPFTLRISRPATSARAAAPR